MKVPSAQILLGYKEFFDSDPPENRLEIISSVSKRSVLFELAALNYRLKPKTEIHQDVSLVTQIRELRYFAKGPALFKKYSRVAELHTPSVKDFPMIFNRHACLFGIEEIVCSGSLNDDDAPDLTLESQWDDILKYYLSVNQRIMEVSDDFDPDEVSFETLNPKLFPVNEMFLDADQFFTPYRSFRLFEYFLSKSTFSEEFKVYFENFYGMHPYDLIKYLIKLYYVETNKDPKLNFFHFVEAGKEENIYLRLSQRIHNEEVFNLLSLRKNPFIRVRPQQYLISDISFLLEKSYTQVLNDFWFDWIKAQTTIDGKPRYSIKEFRSEFGYFFEDYIREILKQCFDGYKYSVLLMFDELKVFTSKGEIEICDVYLRSGNKVLLGQVKSGSIYNAEKYGGGVDKLYKNNRGAFFKNFGVDQIIDSLHYLESYINEVDVKFPEGRSCTIYPCIFFNERVFQTPLMPDIFNKRLNELLKSFESKKITVKPLTMIHVNDIERLEDSLSKKPKEIWDFLDKNFGNKKFIPPFYLTIDKNWYGRNYPPRILEFYKAYLKD